MCTNRMSYICVWSDDETLARNRSVSCWRNRIRLGCVCCQTQSYFCAEAFRLVRHTQIIQFSHITAPGRHPSREMCASKDNASNTRCVPHANLFIRNASDASLCNALNYARNGGKLSKGLRSLTHSHACLHSEGLPAQLLLWAAATSFRALPSSQRKCTRAAHST